MTKKQNLYLILCAVFLTNAVVAEVIGAKIFSVEGTLGVSPAQISFMGSIFDFNMSAGVLNWPIVFITSDLINEYFGRSGVKRISYITAVLIAYAFVMIYLATWLSPAGFWLDVNGLQDGFNINTAFSKIFQQGMNIIVASIIAFVVGQLLDAYIFHRLRIFTANKMLWLRSTGSTIVSQLIDSLLVTLIAFYAFGNWSLKQAISVALVGYIYKFVVAVLMTPVIYFAHGLIDKYLGNES